jgi:hypothetical protein
MELISNPTKEYLLQDCFLSQIGTALQYLPVILKCSILTESALARERATLNCAIVPSGSEMHSANSCATCNTYHSMS